MSVRLVGLCPITPGFRAVYLREPDESVDLETVAIESLVGADSVVALAHVEHAPDREWNDDPSPDPWQDVGAGIVPVGIDLDWYEAHDAASDMIGLCPPDGDLETFRGVAIARITQRRRTAARAHEARERGRNDAMAGREQEPPRGWRQEYREGYEAARTEATS